MIWRQLTRRRAPNVAYGVVCHVARGPKKECVWFSGNCWCAPHMFPGVLVRMCIIPTDSWMKVGLMKVGMTWIGDLKKKQKIV